MNSQKVASPNRALKHAIVDDPKQRTQRAIARRARIDETDLSRILNGKQQATARQRRSLARVLGRPEAELFVDLDGAERLAS